jgi:HEAT repeat protein
VDKAEEEAIKEVLAAKARKDTSFLLRALEDPHARTYAARYLWRLGAVEAVPALLRLLRATDPGARSAGAQALGRLRASEAVPDLIQMAQSDPDLAPQTHAIGALGRIGDKRAQPVLLPLLESPSWFVRASTAWALGQFADSTAIAPLRAASKRERFLARGDYRKAVRQIRRRTRK